MVTKVLQTIKTHNMLQPGQDVIVALSGGADSVALLHILCAIKKMLDIGNIFAVHVNHGLRGNAATQDQNFVAKLCENMRIPLELCKADVSGYAASNNMSIEEAGRELRYLHFNNVGLGKNYKIATGHHANDNAETVIMNLCRGTGLRGLCGIPPVSDNVIRPLIGILRCEIDQYITTHKLQFVEDATNQTNAYTRNRVRNNIIPALQQMVNPQTTRTIAQATTWLRDEEDYLQAQAATALENCNLNGGISATALAALPVAIARRVVRLYIAQFQGLTNITATHVQSVLALAHARSGSSAHIPGLIAIREHQQITITTPTATQEFGQYTLGALSFIPQLGKSISITFHPPSKKPLCTKAFNYDMVKEALTLRTRRPGDKISLGATTVFTKKLKDYFIDKKIPLSARDTIPVLASGNAILWVMDAHNTTNVKYTPHAGCTTCWVNIWSDAND